MPGSLISKLTDKGMSWWTVRFLSGAVGLILLAAALLKTTDMDLFIRQIKDYEIISHHLLLVMSAWGLILAECVLGTALLISYRPKLSISLTAFILLVFLGATLWAWFTGVTEDCGCFGTWLKRTPAEAFIEDLILLAALFPAWLRLKHLPASFPRAKVWSLIVACVAGITLPLLFGFSISRITLSSSEYVDIKAEDLEIKGLEQIDLKHGAYLFVLMDTDCLHCREAVEDLNILAGETDLPDVIALSSNDEGQRKNFVENFQPVFPIKYIEEGDFWRLLKNGEIPRFILIRDQRILKVWDEDLPDIDAIREVLNQ
ncbi:MauE/DoxX family redox-associated membrane protein [Thermodesulfobacteriota bacterium]